MADKIIRNSKLDTFLSKLATKLAAIFWRKAETTQVSVDSTPTANSNNLVKSGGVYSFVGNPIVSMTVPTPNDGTVIFTHLNGDTTILDLNHTHPAYLKYQLCADEAEYQAIQNKESDKLYGIPEV